MKNKKWLAITLSCSIVTGTGGFLVGANPFFEEEKEEAQPNQSDPYILSDSLRKVQRAFDLISTGYVEEIPKEELVEGAIQGMLSALDDPYSVYMDEETTKQFSNTLESEFEGIGAEISKIEGKIYIISPFKNSPAEEAGLKPNDEIISVDGKNVSGMDLYDVTEMIRGEKGTVVNLVIKREGLSKPLEIPVERAEIPNETVFTQTFENKGKTIGYIEITSFSENTDEDFIEELKAFEEKGIDGLLIDVRGNPGGLLSSVENILKELVSNTKPYVQIEERRGNQMQYFSNKKESKEYPVAVLINKGSASASEILAAALKEVEGYTLIGEKTFGKGTVQQAVPMGDGSNIKLTLFKWLTPKGNWIHGKGIEPNVEIGQSEVYYTHPIQLEEPLKRDMNNENVKNAQVILDSLGFEPGRTDGYFSNQTEIAVKAFQQIKGMKMTGVIDTSTAAAMEKAVIEKMNDPRYDLQLQTAIEIIAKKEK
ncbi:MAG TPA: S41 family peptidase [Bacillus sp. (in: firmicutes)]|nr:S41 family peptidase [Bacillus sp. (in: firmicutes)]